MKQWNIFWQMFSELNWDSQYDLFSITRATTFVGFHHQGLGSPSSPADVRSRQKHQIQTCHWKIQDGVGNQARAMYTGPAGSQRKVRGQTQYCRTKSHYLNSFNHMKSQKTLFLFISYKRRFYYKRIYQ